MTLLHTFVSLIVGAAAIPAPQVAAPFKRAVCEGNTAADRSVWCDYSIDTNWYEEAPDTGVTVEVSRQATMACDYCTNKTSTGSMYKTSQPLLMVLSGWFWLSTGQFLVL